MPKVPLPEDLELEEETFMKAYRAAKQPTEATEVLKEYAQVCFHDDYLAELANNRTYN